MDSLRRLRLFVEVATAGGFGAVTERVGLSQPALSRQIRSLERELGTELFDRRQRGAVLTAAGQQLLAEAPLLLDGAASIRTRVQRIAAGAEGELRIGFVGPLILSIVPSLVERLRDARPGVHVELRELTVPRQRRRLTEGRLDIGLMPLSAAPPGWERVPLGETSVRLALPAAHPLAAEAVVPLAALADESWIFLHREFEPAVYDNLLRLCEAAGFEPRIRQRTNRALNILGLVAAGLGVAFAPLPVAERVQVAGVVFREFDPSPPVAAVGAVWRPDHRNPVLRGLRALIAPA